MRRFSVNDLIIAGAMEVFGDDKFVWLVNKDCEGKEPFDGAGVMLPHSPHGLNHFQHIHNAAVLPALNPTPALYCFLDEIAHLDADEVRQGGISRGRLPGGRANQHQKSSRPDAQNIWLSRIAPPPTCWPNCIPVPMS